MSSEAFPDAQGALWHGPNQHVKARVPTSCPDTQGLHDLFKKKKKKSGLGFGKDQPLVLKQDMKILSFLT